jgi:hypothetical protein
MPLFHAASARSISWQTWQTGQLLSDILTFDAKANIYKDAVFDQYRTACEVDLLPFVDTAYL